MLKYQVGTEKFISSTINLSNEDSRRTKVRGGAFLEKLMFLLVFLCVAHNDSPLQYKSEMYLASYNKVIIIT